MPDPIRASDHPLDDLEYQKQVFQATVSELFGDVRKLDNELRNIEEKIDGLAPLAQDIDKRWLAARSRALSAEFETLVSEVLRKETSHALESHSTTFRKAGDRLIRLTNDHDRLPIYLLLSCIIVGILSGIAAACITLYIKASI